MSIRVIRTTALVAIGAMAGSLLAASPASAAGPTAFFWTDRDNATLNRTDSTGATQQLVAPTGGRLQDVDLDAGASTLYFSDWGPVGSPGGEGSIDRVNTDGTGLSQVFGTRDGVHQLALDQAGDRIFFSQGVSYETHEVSVVNDDGTGYTPLFGPHPSGGQGHFPSGLALDAPNASVYWGDIGVIGGPPRGSVNVMNTDGTGQTELTPHVDGRGRGYALHDGIIYLTAHSPQGPAAGGGIFTYDIASDVETQILSDSTTGFWDIEVDPFGERIYFTSYGAGTIESAALDGSDRRVEVSGLTNPYGLALELDTTPPSDPTLDSPSHQVNEPSSDATVDVTWSGASDADGSGVDGFSFEWDRSPGTVPDTIKDAEEGDPVGSGSTTSPPLAHRDDHWFHLRTRDNSGNWTSTVHLGPFVIAPTCRGVPASIVGTDGIDVIRGSSGNDVIQAGPGNDWVRGLGGADLICGGAGDDRIRGGSGGIATLTAAPGARVPGDGVYGDRLFGGPGDDLVIGQGGPDLGAGGQGNDVVKGGVNRDLLRGGGGNDVVKGQGGNDIVRGGGGDDLCGQGGGSKPVKGCERGRDA